MFLFGICSFMTSWVVLATYKRVGGGARVRSQLFLFCFYSKQKPSKMVKHNKFTCPVLSRGAQR